MATWPPPSDVPAPTVAERHDVGPAAADGPAATSADGPAGDPPTDARPGELTPGWRVAFGLGWLAVGVALVAVWTASRQIGLSTWWLGPRSAPQPILITLLPFVAPVVLVAGAVNRMRYLPWFGLLGSLVTAGVGFGDLWRVRGLGLAELLIAVSAAALSLAAITGMYRRDPSR